MTPNRHRTEMFREWLQEDGEAAGLAVRVTWEEGLECFRVTGRRKGVISSVIVSGVEVESICNLQILTDDVLLTMSENIRRAERVRQ